MHVSPGASGDRGNLRSISPASSYCVAHFERMQKRSSVQKLLAFEKSVQDAPLRLLGDPPNLSKEHFRAAELS
jgi:hypothetical protein